MSGATTGGLPAALAMVSGPCLGPTAAWAVAAALSDRQLHLQCPAPHQGTTARHGSSLHNFAGEGWLGALQSFFSFKPHALPAQPPPASAGLLPSTAARCCGSMLATGTALQCCSRVRVRRAPSFRPRADMVDRGRLPIALGRSKGCERRPRCGRLHMDRAMRPMAMRTRPLETRPFAKAPLAEARVWHGS